MTEFSPFALPSLPPTQFHVGLYWTYPLIQP